jgi:glycosyltransferase involved in cell wall biosynthesis
VSIVITYYQTYDLTLRLLKELSIQKTDNVEYILVDDGCTETRFDTFKDFTIIHLAENGGVSRARNIGTDYANGKYIAYCDSDDLVMPDYISHLLNIIDKYSEDVIIYNWLDTTTNEVNRRPQNCAVWKAIYKKDIIPKFDETLRVREDYFWQKDLEQRNPSVYYYDRVLYIYNSGREGSLWWNETHK